MYNSSKKIDSYANNLRYSFLDNSLVSDFYKLFSNILNIEFLEYAKEEREYFLNDLYSPDTFRDSSQRVTIIAQYDESVVGFLVASKIFGGVGFISWLGVEKNFRGNGVAKYLIDSYIDYAKDNQSHLIEVVTFDRIARYYENIGFKRIGKRDQGYFGVENIIMNKSI